MSDPKKELREVKEEIGLVEQQIQELLEHQSKLHERKQQLEKQIQEDQLSASSSSTNKHNEDWDKADFPWSKELEEKSRTVFKVKEFRPLQLQTMNASLSNKDVILIMPTGGGKSLCFQLPAVISKGITLVVSPLVSLMDDQLFALKDLNVNAALINANSTRQEANQLLAAMTDPKSHLKLLYCTPEKLAKSKRFMNKLEKMYQLGRFSRLVIDEVHCCSQWGHDFRPDYKFLGVMKRQFPGVPMMGLTATATTNVVEDVKKILNIPNTLLFRASFNRKNLYYEVRPKPSKSQEVIDDIVSLVNGRFHNQSGIIYCFSRKDCEDVCRELNLHGIKVLSYHSNQDSSVRSAVHQRWLANRIQIVVATVAFGMGIDKPDVRFVIHHSLPKSVENYYQESGRAGRDDQKSICILYASFTDVFRQSSMVFTEQTGLDNLYNMVNYAFDLSRCRRTLVARHFGERWDSADCNEMCDHCDKKGSSIKRDITKYCKDVIRILEHAQSIPLRVTGLKVIDTWLGKGSNAFKGSTVKAPELSRPDCERILIYMLMNGYMREDFHFTAYSTISYLLKGPRAHMLTLNSIKPIEIDLQSAIQASAQKVNANKRKSSTSSQNKTKVKPCVINTSKSAFKSSMLIVHNDKPKKHVESGCGDSDSVTPLQTNRNGSSFERRVARSATKRPITETDTSSSSDTDLDLGDPDELYPVLKKREKSCVTKDSRERSSHPDCIVLDDASDDEEEIKNSNSHKYVKGQSSLRNKKKQSKLTDFVSQHDSFSDDDDFQ